MSEAEAPLCFLCGRPLGRRIEWHHPVPKSRGGRDTVPIHPICHRTIHAVLGNKDLERGYASAETLRAHPEIARFICLGQRQGPRFPRSDAPAEGVKAANHAFRHASEGWHP